MAENPDAPVLKGHCPQCGPNKFADVVGEHLERDDDESGMWFHADYRILKCRGCGTPYFQKSTMFSEDMDHRENAWTGEWESYVPATITHWPSPLRREQPVWLGTISSQDVGLADLMSDVYGALDADLRVPAAIALRTVFDRSSELLGVDPAITFAEKLTELLQQGKISGDERAILETLTDAGNAAAHRGWRPSLSELDTMASIVESFLHRTFVLGDAANKLKASIPPRPKRQAKRRASQPPSPPPASS